MLALYFSALGHPDEKIGLFMTLTLLGDVLISLVLALWADRVGRRRMLMLGGLMMAGCGVVFAMTGNFWILWRRLC
jgi:MFS family permease